MKIIIDKHKKVVPFYHYTKSNALSCFFFVVEEWWWSLEQKEIYGENSVSLEKSL